MATDPAGTDWTVASLLKWTEDYLRKKGIESPKLESQILLAHVLDCPKIQLIVRSDEVPTEEQRTRFKELIKRRVEGCPVSRLVGYREFYLLRFDVSPAVLVPRPETEILVLEGLRLLKGRDQPRVLDIGTGTGCIAISIAHQNQSAHVTATDSSADALAVAQANAQRHGLFLAGSAAPSSKTPRASASSAAQDAGSAAPSSKTPRASASSAAQRIRFLEGDLFAPLPEGEQFDLILSNPPYIADEEFADLSVEVRDHDPHAALSGGSDGLSVLRPLIEQAPRYLLPQGHLMVEIGYRQEEAVRGLFEQAGFQDIQTFRDGAGHPRAILGKWAG